MKVSYQIVEIDKLKNHEELQDKLLNELVDQIRKDGFIRKPIIVEDQHYVILDGHHRWEALKILGCRKIPVYLVDYFDSAIVVKTWPGAIVDKVEKEEVIRRGLSGELFPAKTTRHIISQDLKEVRVKLKDLA